MGFAIAEAYANAGAEVTIISGPTAMKPVNKGIRVISVTSAAEMLEQCKRLIGEMDLALFSAAVADFTPEITADKKISRGKEDLLIRLKPTVDIAAELGKGKRENQLFVGFALETDEGTARAAGKLQRKNLDLIVLNTLADDGAGFGTETNKVTLIDKSGNIDKFELKLKTEVALDIVERTIKLMNNA